MSATLGNGASLPDWLSFNAATQTFSGIPPQDFNGTLSLRVTATDAGGLSASSTFNLAIAAVNDAPVVATALTNQNGTEDTVVNFTIPANTFSDVDDASLILSATLGDGSTLPDWLSFDATTRTFSGTPPQDFNGTLNLKVMATDSGNLSTSSTFDLAIAAVNDAPVLTQPNPVAFADTANDDDFVSATGTLSATDPDGGQTLIYGLTDAVSDNSLSGFNLSRTGAYGTLYLNSNTGAYQFIPNDTPIEALKTNTSELFTVIVNDGNGGSDSKTLTINLTGANDIASIGGLVTGSVAEDANDNTLTTTGSLSVSDRDAGDAIFSTTVTPVGSVLGNLTITEQGAWSYSIANSAVQYLGQNDTRVEKFTVRSIDGTATKDIEITITGVNDAAVIGTPTVTGVTEDSATPPLTATGSISIADVDQGEASFKTVVTEAEGTLGSLVLAANGDYTYSVANSAVQFLGAGQTKTETFTVEALDGTTKQVSFTITGVNDAAVIGNPTVTGVTEDAATPNLTATGTLSISDADLNQSAFKTTVAKADGTLGNLVLAADGTYTYSVANSAVQFLGAGQTKTETFTVEALDGTTKQVSFTITGVNDIATIAGTATAFVKEETLVNNGKLTSGGKLTVSDVDQGEAFFNTGVSFKNNSLNSAALGVLTIDVNGNFSYSVDNNKSQIQSLGVGQTITETFTVKSKDGTGSQDTAITINGTNDEPIVAVPSRLTQTTQYSDAVQEVVFSATDLDAGDALTGNIAYSYNGGTFINGLPDAGSVAGSLNFTFDASSNSWKLGGIADVAAGQYQFRFRATDSQGAFSDAFTKLTVNHENAQTLFDGQTFVSSDSSGNARVTLRSIIQDVTALGLDPTGGNISIATVNFVNRATGATLANNVPVTLVQQGNQLVGMATFDWNVNIGNADSNTFTIGTVVNGNFYSQNSSLEDTTVTISKPTGQFISGGGYTILSDSTGQFAGDDNSRFNYGFNIKTSKSQNSYQGKFTGIFRQTDAGADGITGTADDMLRTYQIRSNAADSLVVQAGVNLDGNITTKEDGVAVFRSKATLVDVTNPLAPISLGGNLQLEVSIQDWGEPAVNDRINVRLWNGSGTKLLYSNTDIMGSINPSNPLQHQLIVGGNIDIH